MGGRGPRQKQKKLAAKLKRIRLALGLSQPQILKEMGLGVDRAYVSGYESGRIEPPISTLLLYCDLANICADVLLRDELKLPDELPCKERYYPH